MPTRLARLPRLGVGLVHGTAVEPLLAEPGLADFAEVEPQTLATRPRDGSSPYVVPPELVRRLAALPVPKLLHSVASPVGGTRPPDAAHLRALAGLQRSLGAPWVSEHLGFNQASGPGAGAPLATGFFLPPHPSAAGVAAAARSTRAMQAALGVPVAVETGVNYLRPREDDLDDGAFTAAVAEAADCAILLDLHNVWCNERNGRQTVEAFVAQLPLHRVIEVHLAGGMEDEGYWLDAHSGLADPELLALARRVLPRLPNLKALTFEILPGYAEQVGLDAVRGQMKELRRLWDWTFAARTADGSVEQQPSAPPAPPASAIDHRLGETPEQWEDTLAALALGRAVPGALARSLADDPGIGVYQRLVANARASALVLTLPLTCRLLHLRAGRKGFEEVVHGFWRAAAPEPFSADEARAFRRHVERSPPAVPGLAEVLALECAVLDALVDGWSGTVTLPWRPDDLARALHEQRLPPEAGQPVLVDIDPDTAAAWAGVARA